MNKEIVNELIDLYQKTVDDNKEDFITIMTILNKLCGYLLYKNVLTKEEVESFFKIEKLEEK